MVQTVQVQMPSYASPGMTIQVPVVAPRHDAFSEEPIVDDVGQRSPVYKLRIPDLLFCQHEGDQQTLATRRHTWWKLMLEPLCTEVHFGVRARVRVRVRVKG